MTFTPELDQQQYVKIEMGNEPFDIYVESKRGQGDAAAKPEKRPVYIIRCGAYIPMPVVEVDATDGTVLKWQTFPR